MSRAPIAAALAGAALAFAACSPKPASDMPAGGATPPADAPAATPAEASVPAPAAAPASGPDFTKPINAVGTEPFWAVDIRGDSLKLAGPDRKDLLVTGGGPTVTGDTAVWQGKAADGTPLKVTLNVEACSDGMSDLAYPYRARVETTAEMLNGCAAPVDAWPKQPDQNAASR